MKVLNGRPFRKDGLFIDSPLRRVYYQEFKAIVDILTCEISEGNLPAKQAKLVVAWAELHKDELIADWELASNGETPFKIEPLK